MPALNAQSKQIEAKLKEAQVNLNILIIHMLISLNRVRITGNTARWPPEMRCFEKEIDCERRDDQVAAQRNPSA